MQSRERAKLYKKTVSAIMLSLLVISMLTLALKIQIVKANDETIYIRTDGSIDPPNAPIYTADNITYTLTGNIEAGAEGIVIGKDNIVIDGQGCTVQGSFNGTGITLSGRSNVTIKNTTIETFGRGIWLDSSSNNTISGNNITANNWMGIYLVNENYDSVSFGNSIVGNNITANNGVGVYLVGSSNNRVSANNIINNRDGVVFENCGNNTISGNKITNNTIGAYIEYNSGDINIVGNNITNNGEGIDIDDAWDNSISENNITNNNAGIYLIISGGTIISGNNILNNEQGIYFSNSTIYPEGPYISGSSESTSQSDEGGASHNTVYQNTFVNNTSQVYSSGSNNIWDDGYPSGGNYWSDYNGTDLYYGPGQNKTEGDGIGDTPYVIDSNNTDHYPFVNPLVIPSTKLIGDLNLDGKVNNADVTLLSYSYSSKSGDTNWNPNADLAAPYGIIGLTDLVTLALHYGQHSP